MTETVPVIALLDMDCFYVQVEARENPSISGIPAAVVQYKTWKGGGIIAVNYEARAKGVTRQMRGDEAKEKCPDIVLVRVPETREKADLTKYRKAGREVIEVLLDSGATVERASIDEAYLDLTAVVEKRLKDGQTVSSTKLPNTFVGGDDGDRDEAVKDWCQQSVEDNGDDLRLVIGAQIMEEIRAEVYSRTQFRCSAGIAHCKTLAKLCCGLHKPNKQTVLPQSSIPSLYKNLSVTKVRGLGGKLGQVVVESLGVQTMMELADLPPSALEAKLDSKTVAWLRLLFKGRDGEVVKERELPKSIGCGKNFRGREMLNTREKVKLRLMNLVEELVERIEVDKDDYNRVAKGLTVGVGLDGEGYVSRAGQINAYNVQDIFREAFTLLSRLNQAPAQSEDWSPALVNISISAGKFEEVATNIKSITSYFSPFSATSTTNIGSQKQSNAQETTSTSSSDLRSHASNKQNIEAFFQPSCRESSKPLVDEYNVVVDEHHEGCKSVKSFFKSKVFDMDRSSSGMLLSVSDEIAVITKEDMKTTESNSNNGNKEKQASKTENMIEVADDQLMVQSEKLDVDIAELIPSLQSFSPTLLSILPVGLQAAAKKRVKELQEKETGLGKFFQKSQSEVAKEELVSCSVCNRQVSPFTLPEHLDWHYAQSVAKESSSYGGVKRKSVDGLSSAAPKNKRKSLDISSFFRK